MIIILNIINIISNLSCYQGNCLFLWTGGGRPAASLQTTCGCSATAGGTMGQQVERSLVHADYKHDRHGGCSIFSRFPAL